VWILRSYRWRRRLIIWTIVVAVASPLIYLGVHFSSGGSPQNANGPTVPNPVQEPKHAPFTPSSRRAVHRLLKDFISTAVARHDVAHSWGLVSSTLKQGVTRKEWNRGQIPVVPYPAADKGLGNWSYVAYSYPKTVGLEVYVFPKPGSGWSAMSADAEVVKGHDGRWRISYWMPKKFHGPPAVAAATKTKSANARAKIKHVPKRSRSAPTQAAPTAQPTKASRAYWAIPLGILSLIVVLPLSIGVFVWIRNRRAEAEYQRSRG
jgi:hypothetical protein